MVNHNFLADKPVSNKVEDRFQRYNFSKRIAETVTSRDNDDSLVIGIYGAWGEGKTSILNFIEGELSKDTNTLIIKFNPWRYKDEDTLLLNFLNKVALLLDKNPKTAWEKIGGLVEKTKGVSVGVGIIKVDLSSIGSVLANVNLEEIKKRVDKFLKDSKKRLVVFIDDIDRLDKQEIYSIFRLVKLTGDFTNTIYILSFDEKMVASAIGDRFGEGNKEAGDSFLEKIIQVPLKIPKAQDEALRKYCFELTDKALQASEVKLTNKEQMRFVNSFTSNVLLMLHTPRLAVRYSNALSFALPLLKGEANMVDLILIEAVKIFYPEFYDYIKKNSEIFTDSITFSTYTRDERKKETKEIVGLLSEKLSKREKTAIKNLLIDLFPVLKSTYENYDSPDSSIDEWYREKRIVSEKYFERYFSYTVIAGDISDINFGKFLEESYNLSVEEITDQLKEIIQKSSDEKLIQKLRNVENSLDWEVGKKLALSICNNSEMLSNSSPLFGGYTAPRAQATIFIYNILKNHSDKAERFDFALELLSVAKDIDFAFELNNWYRYEDKPEDKVFTFEQYIEFFKELLSRSTQESDMIFEKYVNNIIATNYLLVTWAAVDKKTLNEYVTTRLDAQPEKVLYVIKSITPAIIGADGFEAGKIAFTSDSYETLKSSLDVDYLYSKIKQAYGNELELERVFWEDFGKKQTDLNILRQFEALYQRDKKIIPF